VLLFAVAAAITGFLAFNTYVTPFLLDVSGFGPSALAPLLFVSGAAGIAGTITVSRTLDSWPIASLLAPLGVGSASLLGLYLLGSLHVATVVLLAGIGISFSSFATALQNRMLQIAPGNTDIASAGVSTAFNLGIAAGSLVGGALLPTHGPRVLAGVGALLTLSALVTLAIERRVRIPVP
jgi:DHA1 family L-arabinose/isopropyl-beta-D-thiogalactopyranoside export protein-like MFS transporter/DHA1 family inner membrane transport protein